MKLLKRKPVFVLIEASLAIVAFFLLWTFFPWPDRTYYDTNGVKVTEKREFRWLPQNERQFSREEVSYGAITIKDNVQYGRSSGTRRIGRFWFFEMTDDRNRQTE
jgi:hypothetical protein